MDWLFWVLIFVVLITAGFSIVAGAIVAADAAVFTTLRGEGDFGFALEIWAIVWGSVAIVYLIVLCIDRTYGGMINNGYSRANGNVNGGKATFLTWIWGLLLFFLAVPWLFVGQIFLLREYVGDDGEEAFLYGSAIAALVVSYILLATLFGILSNTMESVARATSRAHRALFENDMVKEQLSEYSALRYFPE